MDDPELPPAEADSRCLYCRIFGKDEPLVYRPAKARVVVAGRRFDAIVRAAECDACGQRFDLAERRAFERDVALQLAHDGTTAPQAVKFIREATSLETSQWAKLLGVSRQTVYRWEKGLTPVDRAAFAVLRQILVEARAGRRDLRDYLARLAAEAEAGAPPKGKRPR